MNTPLSKVVLVENKQQFRTLSMQKKLQQAGFNVLDSFEQITGISSKLAKLNPDVLVISTEYLDAKAIDELVNLNSTNPLPVLVTAQQHAPQVLRTVVSAGVNSYIVDDIKAERLPVVIDLAIERFKQLDKLSAALHQTQEKLTQRKLIEKAKGVLMQQKGLSEADAYAQMRNTAMNQGQSMAKLSQQIISVFELLE